MVWWEILLTIISIIVIIVLGIIVIRISFTFDINRFFENRRNIKLNQLKNICPHCHITLVTGNKVEYESLFSSPRGAIKWQCRQCGLIVNSEEDVNDLARPFLKDIELYIKRRTEFFKLAKKLKLC